MNDTKVRVSYLELMQSPAPVPPHTGDERIAAESMSVDEYLDLYQRVGESLRWDQRLKMPQGQLRRLLQSAQSRVYVLRDAHGESLGLCEFERARQDVELKNFGLVPRAQGKGLGPWLLLTALHQEWEIHPGRIWLHSDSWDHPAALRIYRRAGFRIFGVRDEPPGDL